MVFRGDVWIDYDGEDWIKSIQFCCKIQNPMKKVVYMLRVATAFHKQYSVWYKAVTAEVILNLIY